jgi:outer membrane protein assembly factor BamB
VAPALSPAHQRKILWQKTLYKGVPKIRRHPHNSYASATPATDGKHVVVLLGSEGLYTYNCDGRLLWKKAPGVVHAGKHNNPAYEWGTASSPVLYRGQVTVLCDAIENGFLAAFDVKSGGELWRTDRQVNPSWTRTPIFKAMMPPAARSCGGLVPVRLTRHQHRSLAMG